MTPALLVVNADDFGITSATADAIFRAHHEGIVTSTSVLVVAPAAASSVARLADHPDLGVGVHLALSGEDPPVLTAREIPTLVGANGRLASSWRHLLPRLATGRVDQDDVRRELAAQLDQAASWGLELDHLDTHQNVHLWPSVAAVVLDLAVERGIRAIRRPRTAAAGPRGWGIRRLSDRLGSAIADRGLVTSTASAGLDQAGHLDVDRLVATIGAVGAALAGAPEGTAGTAEIGSHPGADTDPDRARYAWDYQWGLELSALCSQAGRDAVERAGFRLGTWKQAAAAP